MPILHPIIAQPTFLEGHVPILTSDNWSGMACVPKERKGTIVDGLGAVHTLHVKRCTTVLKSFIIKTILKKIESVYIVHITSGTVPCRIFLHINDTLYLELS